MSTRRTKREPRPGTGEHRVRSARPPSRLGQARARWSSTSSSMATSIERMASNRAPGPSSVAWSIQNTRSPRTDLTAICAPASFLPSQISPSVYRGATRLISSRTTHTASRVMNCACANPRASSWVAKSSERSERERPRRTVSNRRLGVATTTAPATPLALAFLRRFFLFPDALTAWTTGVFVVGRRGVFPSLDGFSRFHPPTAHPVTWVAILLEFGSDLPPRRAPPASEGTPQGVRRHPRRPRHPPRRRPPPTRRREPHAQRRALPAPSDRAISRWSHPSGRGTSAERDAAAVGLRAHVQRRWRARLRRRHNLGDDALGARHPRRTPPPRSILPTCVPPRSRPARRRAARLSRRSPSGSSRRRGVPRRRSSPDTRPRLHPAE